MAQRIPALLVAAALWAATGVAAVAATVGTVVRVEGTVEVVAGGTATPAHIGLPIDSADSVRSATDGKVLIELLDGSTVAVAADTEISMAELSVDSGGGFISGILDLISGAIRVLAAPSPAERRLEIRTGMGVAAVRSTEFFVEASPKGMAVFVWNGRVAVSPATADMTMDLTAGEGVDIKPAADDRAVLIMPRAPVRWGEARIADAEERTRVE